MKRKSRSHPLFLSILLFFIFLFPALLSAQPQNCGTVSPPGYQPERIQNAKEYQDFLRTFQQESKNRSSTSCISYAPVKVHIIRNSDGSGGLSTVDLNAAMDSMNFFYTNSCMAFYLCGAINYIDEDTLYSFDKTEEGDIATHDVANVINIYFFDEVTDGADFLCGYAYYPGGDDRIIMDNSCAMNGSTLAHEMGHFFSLPHTHNGSNELVDGSNCSSAGDYFCDTPADPKLSYTVVDASCTYIGTDMDANGDSYIPNTNNIMSYSRKPCRDEFSSEQYAAISYAFLNVRNYWNCASLNVDFTVDVTTSCEAPLTVNFTEMSSGETSYKWDFDNDGSIDNTTANPSHTYASAGTFDVSLTISDGVTEITKVRTAYISTASKAYPYVQSMESFTKGTNATGYEDNWTTSPAGTTGSYRWNVNDDETPSTDTGPDGDHTEVDGSGIYLFTEASGYTAGDVAELVSPCIDVSLVASDPSIRFWYHMFGAGMGDLHVDVNDGTGWDFDVITKISAPQQTVIDDPYTEKIFSLSAYAGESVQVRFRAVRGSGFTSDMAIDDFEFFDNVAAPVDLLYFRGKTMKNSEHLLTWATAWEENSSYFSLEHSTDGQRFEPLNKLGAQGQSTTRNDYQVIHQHPAVGINYYRLKMVDWDGTYEYTTIISLRKESSESELSVYPNPGEGQYQLEWNSSHKEVTYQVFNTVGQQLKEGNWNPRETALSLDLKAFPNGIYLVQIRHRNQLVAFQRLVKQ